MSVVQESAGTDTGSDRRNPFTGSQQEEFYTMSQQTAPSIDESTDVVDRVWQLLFGSALRFLIFLGVVLFVLAATWAEGVTAGHLGIYGVTGVLVGVVGRAIVWWRTQDEY